MKHLHATKSICPVCARQLDAAIVQKGDDVYLEKTCPDHGPFSALIWRGAVFLIRHGGANARQTFRLTAPTAAVSAPVMDRTPAASLWRSPAAATCTVLSALPMGAPC